MFSFFLTKEIYEISNKLDVRKNLGFSTSLGFYEIMFYLESCKVILPKAYCIPCLASGALGPSNARNVSQTNTKTLKFWKILIILTFSGYIEIFTKQKSPNTFNKANWISFSFSVELSCVLTLATFRKLHKLCSKPFKSFNFSIF